MGLTLFLILCAAFGATQGARWYGWSDPWLLGVGGLTFGLFTTLGLVNLLLRANFELTQSIWSASCLILVGLGVTSLGFKRSAAGTKMGSKESICLLAMTLVVWLYTNASQFGLPDQDYWIHAPLQRYMLDGLFPPVNPFFPELELHGHYGRDLLIVLVANLGRMTTFQAQCVVTSLCQAMAFSLFYIALRRLSNSRLQAFLGTYFLYFGANGSYRAGWIDEFVGPAAVTHLHWTLLVLLGAQWFRKPDKARTFWLGALLGVHGFVFTTSFGLCALALVGTAVAIQRNKRTLFSLLLVFVLAGSIAAVQGGALSDLVTRDISGGELSQARQNQSQSVKVSLSGKPFLSLARSAQDPSRSLAYQYPPWSALYHLIDGPGLRYSEKYVPIWSWEILKIHWLPLYLAPFSFFTLYRSKHAFGMLCWFYGVLSFVVPALLNFGPVQESDWLRWIFTTSSGTAPALGISLAILFQRLARAGLNAQSVSLSVMVALITVPGLSFLFRHIPGTIMAHGNLAQVTTGRLEVEHWLLRHSRDFRMAAEDIRVLQWLNLQDVSGERVLVNFRSNDPWGIQFESTLAAYTGCWVVGHDYPLDSDVIGLPPVRMKREALELLTEPSSVILARLDVDWIYLRTRNQATVERLSQLPELRMVFREPAADQHWRVVFKNVSQGVPRETL